MATELRLRPLRQDDEQEALRAHEELLAEDFPFLLEQSPDQPWPDYVARLDEVRQGLDLAPDRVPAAFLLGEVDGQIVGRVSIRFELNDYLAMFGGHIGYAVRPGFRRRGYATELLRQGLDVARSHGLARVLLTCDVGNVGSARTITACGGILENVVKTTDAAPDKSRYWIDLAPVAP